MCAKSDGVCVVQIIKCGSQFRWICISVHLGQTMNWIICGFMEVNMGDAADESMKTHISNVLMMIIQRVRSPDIFEGLRYLRETY